MAECSDLDSLKSPFVQYNEYYYWDQNRDHRELPRIGRNSRRRYLTTIVFHIMTLLQSPQIPPNMLKCVTIKDGLPHNYIVEMAYLLLMLMDIDEWLINHKENVIIQTLKGGCFVVRIRVKRCKVWI